MNKAILALAAAIGIGASTEARTRLISRQKQ